MIPKFPEEEVDWALSVILAMQHMKGFPDNEQGIRAVARGVLRIAHPRLVCQRKAESNPEPGSTEVPIGLVYVDSDKFGPVAPVDWLVDQCLDKFTYFPSLRQMRAVFMRYFPSADGEEPAPEPGRDID